jgi:hypothetical protein
VSAGRFSTERAETLIDYFVNYLGQMRASSRKMLEESFRGVLED